MIFAWMPENFATARSAGSLSILCVLALARGSLIVCGGARVGRPTLVVVVGHLNRTRCGTNGRTTMHTANGTTPGTAATVFSIDDKFTKEDGALDEC